jgi:hypothetical protein
MTTSRRPPRSYTRLKQSVFVHALLDVCNDVQTFQGRWWKTERRKLLEDVAYVMAPVSDRGTPKFATKYEIRDRAYGKYLARARFELPMDDNGFIYPSFVFDPKKHGTLSVETVWAARVMADARIGLSEIVRERLSRLLHRCAGCNQLLFSRTKVCPGAQGRKCSGRLRAPERRQARLKQVAVTRQQLVRDFHQRFPGRPPCSPAEMRASLKSSD